MALILATAAGVALVAVVAICEWKNGKERKDKQ